MVVRDCYTPFDVLLNRQRTAAAIGRYADELYVILGVALGIVDAVEARICPDAHPPDQCARHGAARQGAAVLLLRQYVEQVFSGERGAAIVDREEPPEETLPVTRYRLVVLVRAGVARQMAQPAVALGRASDALDPGRHKRRAASGAEAFADLQGRRPHFGPRVSAVLWRPLRVNDSNAVPPGLCGGEAPRC